MLNKKGNETMIVDDLEFEVEPVYRYRVMRCMNDELRNPEKAFDLYFSSNSFRMAMRIKEREIREDKFGDRYEIWDSGSFEPNIINTRYASPELGGV
jgi:hypothetical protein